jgi:hypothetical protein
MGGANYDGESSVEWWTPPHVFGALGMSFDLDPCAPPLPAMPWLPAARRISLPQDGLTAAWNGHVWLNPPYGKQTQAWTDKLICHGDGIALVFARTDTAWCQRAMRAAGAVCFPAGRLSFIDGTQPGNRKGHNAAVASMLLGYGRRCAEAVLGCGLGMAYAEPVPSALDSHPSLFDLEAS